MDHRHDKLGKDKSYQLAIMNELKYNFLISRNWKRNIAGQYAKLRYPPYDQNQ